MARIARVVAPGFPHQIMQCGNRRQKIFFQDEDYQLYIQLMATFCSRFKVEVWAYCLMPNQIHLIVVPQSEEGLRQAIGEAHRHYTHHVNFRKGWKGHFWQGRFSSFPVDMDYLPISIGYVEQNPVRAKLVERSEQYSWSSAIAHCEGRDDALVKVSPLLSLVDDWPEFISREVSRYQIQMLRLHERTGRPLGGEPFVTYLEKILGRVLRPQKTGPKQKSPLLSTVLPESLSMVVPDSRKFLTLLDSILHDTK